MRRNRRLVAFAALALAAVFGAWLFGDVLGELTGVRAFEDFTLDLRQETTAESFQPGRGDRESEIVLVLFDELAFQDAETWITPFPRAHLAELVNAVSAAGARTIGVDVYLDRRWEALSRVDRGDDLLRDAIERAGNVVLVSPVQRTDSGYTTPPPDAFFADVAADVGTAELPASYESFRDGTLAVRSGSGLEPSFALALYAHARGLDVDALLDEALAEGRLELPGLPASLRRLPAGWLDGDPDADPILPFRIRYAGPPSGTMASDPPGTFRAVGSSTAPLLAMLAPETFEGKIVLLGTGFHPQDRFRTPFYGYSVPRPDGSGTDRYEWMYGVEIHANALQNIIDGTYVRPIGAVARLLLLSGLALVTAGAVFRWGSGWGAVALAGAVVATWAVAFWAWAGLVYLPGVALPRFAGVGTWVPVGTPILAALLGYVDSVAYTAIVEGRDKRVLKGAFSKYTSPTIVAEILEDPSVVALGGEKRPLSLLFSDLSGFTSIAEDMDAQELIALLNEYLHDMTQVVLDEMGYLDKYIGDAVMAFWNAPVDVPDHADRALRTAVLMQQRMDALNRRWAEATPDHEPLEVRIGVHTGEAVVGNVGGKDRFDYSAIGDDVNLAARLEPANKTYDTLNMVSEAALLAGTPGAYRVRELDVIAVKGKDEPVKVFELLGFAGLELPPGKEAALEHFAAGMKAYRAHDWTGALACFEAGVAAWPDDGPSALYVARCRQNIEDPPPPDWDFVVRRTEK